MLLPARPNQALNALRPRLRRLQRLTTPRAHSSPLSSLQSAPPETLSVPCRSNGAVTLRLVLSCPASLFSACEARCWLLAKRSPVR
jgi:hypothetical protein